MPDEFWSFVHQDRVYADEFWLKVLLLATSNSAEAIWFRPRQETPLMLVVERREHVIPLPSSDSYDGLFDAAGWFIGSRTVFRLLEETSTPWKGIVLARLATWLRRELAGEVAVEVGDWRIDWSATWAPRQKTVRFTKGAEIRIGNKYSPGSQNQPA